MNGSTVVKPTLGFDVMGTWRNKERGDEEIDKLEIGPGNDSDGGVEEAWRMGHRIPDIRDTKHFARVPAYCLAQKPVQKSSHSSLRVGFGHNEDRTEECPS